MAWKRLLRDVDVAATKQWTMADMSIPAMCCGSQLSVPRLTSGMGCRGVKYSRRTSLGPPPPPSGPEISREVDRTEFDTLHR